MSELINIPVDGRTRYYQPGKYVMSNEDYHSDRHYFSSSQLKQALVSPAHFKYYTLERNSKHESTPAMELGTLIHMILLEPHLFDSTYVIHTGDTNKDGSIPKASARILEGKYPGLTPISKKWYDMACLARQNIEKYPAANELIYSKDAEYEPSYFTQCPETGLRLRVRPDMIDLNKGVIVDVKTTYAATKHDFIKDAKYSYHYDLSAWTYLYVIYLLTGQQCEFYFVTIGKEGFVPVAVYKSSLTFLEAGKDKFYKAVENIRSALTLPDNYLYQTEVEEI